MAYEEILESITLEAASDLSGSQYMGVAVDGNGRAILAGEGGGPTIGVLQNKPQALGHAATVGVKGITKVWGGATVTRGSRFSFNSAGKAVGVGSGDDYAMGVVLEALAADKIGTVLLQPTGPMGL